MAKLKNYLVRTGGDKFLLGRGEKIDDGVAVVRLYKELDPIPNSWCIIDIASGLYIGVQCKSSKRAALEAYEKRSKTAEFKSAVSTARRSGSYKTRCEELLAEKQLWRLSGYEID